jgi:hypothetical protein
MSGDVVDVAKVNTEPAAATVPSLASPVPTIVVAPPAADAASALHDRNVLDIFIPGVFIHDSDGNKAGDEDATSQSSKKLKCCSRQCLRPLVLLSTSATVIIVYIAVLLLLDLSTDYVLLPSQPTFELEVVGCDILIAPAASLAAASTVTISRRLLGVSVTTIFDPMHARLSFVSLVNSGGCDARDPAQLRCSPTCLVSIYVDADAPPGRITLTQRAVDNVRRNHVDVMPGTVVNELYIIGGFEAVIDEVTVIGRLRLWGGASSVTARDLSFTSPSAEVDLRTTSGPLAVLWSSQQAQTESNAQTRSPSSPLTIATSPIAIQFRTHQHDACFDAGAGGAFVAAPPFAACDPTADETIARRVIDAVDADRDGFVTREEFEALFSADATGDGRASRALPKCCGAACPRWSGAEPFGSVCPSLEHRVFPLTIDVGDAGATAAQAGRTGRGAVTDAVFLQRLLDTGDSTLVPWCRRGLRLVSASAAARQAAMEKEGAVAAEVAALSMILVTETGTISVSNTDVDATDVGGVYTQPLETTTRRRWSPSGKAVDAFHIETSAWSR